ncbi:alanine racemase [Rubrivirga sp.]|uniref:alanine racemase n=1 Tax=Rubrivirga sp. TaxID=1885344 RepID=UPI003C7066E4
MLVSDLPTPALLVDRARLTANLDAMAARAEAQGVALRPHVKTHKCPEIARLQTERGAQGITVATVLEAEAFADAGFDDIRMATPPVGPKKAERLAALAGRGGRISFTTDSLEGVRQAQAAFLEAGQSAGVLIEVDTGYGRCGVDWDDLDALTLVAGAINEASALELVGLLSHGGHAYTTGSADQTKDQARREVMDAERDRVLEAATRLVEAGRLRSDPELSVGSTPGVTVFTNAERGGLTITEVRPGTYVFFDAGQVSFGAARLQDCALTCIGTVVSQRRFDDGTERTITDAGKKILTADRRTGSKTFGTVLYSPRTMIAHPHAIVSALSEEHGWVDTPGGSIWDVGDPVFVVPNHACVAVATRSTLYVVDGDEVIDTWDVVGR